MKESRRLKKRPKASETHSTSSSETIKSESDEDERKRKKLKKSKSKQSEFYNRIVRPPLTSTSPESDEAVGMDVSQSMDTSHRVCEITRTPTKTSKKSNNHDSESDDDNLCETRTRSPIASPSPNCKRKRQSESDSGLSEDKIDSCGLQYSPRQKRRLANGNHTSNSENTKSEPDTDEEPILAEEFVPDFEDYEIEIPSPGEQELEHRASTSSSDTASDAENELNVEFRPEDDALLDIVALDDNNFAAHVQHVPILQEVYRDHRKYVEVRLHSRREFSVEMFVEHYQTSARIHQYTPALIEEGFRLIDRRYWRYEQGQGMFVITLTTALYDFLMRTLNHRPDPILHNVFNVLAFYQPLDNPANLRRKTGYLEYMAVLDNLSANSTLQILPHQRDAISFAISRGGRCMFADEPRMGKGVEAIFSAYFYRKEWPMIIVCPASLQCTWKSELVKWLPNEENGPYKILNLRDIDECQALDKLDDLDLPDVIIIGYTLLQKSAEVLKERKFKVMILDQSHRIKHAWTSTSKSALHLIKRSRRRFLLTSNPAFGVPIELFRQLHVINRSYFKDYRNFSDRYCGMQYHIDENGRTIERASTKWSDAKNLKELQHLLFGTVAIRASREDLDVNLPIKLREKVLLNFDPDVRTRRILGDIYNRSKSDLADILDKQSMSNAKIFIWYKKSGSAKMLEICKYLDQFDLKKKKTIIYARHKNVLEGIEQLLKVKHISYVRIKGNYEERKNLCQNFNGSKKVRVALVSMGISDVCVKLHTADTVIFTELYWVPDDLLRNEERALKQFKPHKKCVPKKIEVKYLIASDPQNARADQIHIDTHLWELLAGKMDLLQKLGLVRDDFTFTMPETRFEPVHSSVIDDLVFQALSSGGSNSEAEYNPEDDSEAYRESSSDSNSAVDSNELSDEDDSEVESPIHGEADSQENSPEHEEQGTSQPQSPDSLIVDDDSPDSPVDIPPLPSREGGTNSTPQRATRSQTAKIKEAQNDSDTESESSSNEDSIESNDEVPARRPQYERIRDESDRSSDDETNGSMDSFVVDKSGEDGDSESEDKEYSPNKKKKKVKKQKKQNKTVSFPPAPRRERTSSSSSGSSSGEYSGEEYRKNVKKQSKSYFL